MKSGKDTGNKALRGLSRDLLILLALGVFLLGFIIRWQMKEVPFERDEGEYATIAWMTSQGLPPYLEAFDQKPPLIFWVYRVAFASFGSTYQGLRLFSVWYMMAASLFLYFLIKRLLARESATIGTLAFILLTSGPVTVQGHAFNTELVMCLPLILALLYFVGAPTAKNPSSSYLVSGVFSGLAVLAKLPGVFNAAFLALVLGWRIFQSDDKKQRIGELALFTLGVISPGVILAIYLVTTKSLTAFWDAVISHNLAYAAVFPWSDALITLKGRIKYFVRYDGIVWLMAVLGAVWFWRKDRARFCFLFGWLVASLLGVAMQRYFRGHYFIQLFPVIAVFCAGSYEAFKATIAKLSSSEATPKLVSMGLCCCLFVAGPIRANAFQWFRATPKGFVRSVYGYNPFLESLDVSNHIQSNSTENDRIFILGSEPQMYFYSKRLPATKYIFTYPLFGSFEDSKTRQETALRQIQAAAPAFIIVVHVPWSIAVLTTSQPKPDYSQPLFLTISDLTSKQYVEDGATWYTPRSTHFRAGPPVPEDPGDDSIRTLTVFRRKS
jgi:hypothetical protein